MIIVILWGNREVEWWNANSSGVRKFSVRGLVWVAAPLFLSVRVVVRRNDRTRSKCPEKDGIRDILLEG